MGKKSRERDLADNEAKAVARNIRVSPQKLNLVAALIRGKAVAAALADLQFSRKRIARDAGRKQWAYKGKPLYLSSRDRKPGDRTGHGVDNMWRIARP